MIDSFVNFGDHGNPKSGENKGRCQPPLSSVVGFWLLGHDICLSRDRGKGGAGAGVVFPGGGGGSMFHVISLWEQRVTLLSRL